MEFNVEGDDGELYALGGSILSLALEKMDMVNLCYAKGKGGVVQLRNSIYKLARYPGTVMNKFFAIPRERCRSKCAKRALWLPAVSIIRWSVLTTAPGI